MYTESCLYALHLVYIPELMSSVEPYVIVFILGDRKIFKFTKHEKCVRIVVGRVWFEAKGWRRFISNFC